MRQMVVDFWRVFGTDLGERLPAGTKLWWTLIHVAGNLMDIDFMLMRMDIILTNLTEHTNYYVPEWSDGSDDSSS